MQEATQPVSFLKRVPMTSCSPTFKLTLPSEFVQAHMAHLVEAELRLTDESEARVWPIMLMPRKNKDKYEYTLQGWRAYVVDCGIQPGDRLEFELLEDGRLKATIVRRTPYTQAPTAASGPQLHNVELSRDSSHSGSMDNVGAYEPGWFGHDRVVKTSIPVGHAPAPAWQLDHRDPIHLHCSGDMAAEDSRLPSRPGRAGVQPAPQMQPPGWDSTNAVSGQKRSWSVSGSSSEDDGRLMAQRAGHGTATPAPISKPSSPSQRQQTVGPTAQGMALLSSAAVIDGDRERLRRALALANERAEQAELTAEACQAVLRHTGQVIEGQTSRGLIVASALLTLGNTMGSEEVLGQMQANGEAQLRTICSQLKEHTDGILDVLWTMRVLPRNSWT